MYTFVLCNLMSLPFEENDGQAKDFSMFSIRSEFVWRKYISQFVEMK